MHLRQKTRLKKTWLIAALITTLVLLSPSALFANQQLDDLKKQEAAGNQKVNSLQKDVQQNQNDLDQVNNEVGGIQDGIVAVQNQMQQDEQRIIELTNLLSQKQQALTTVQTDLAETFRDLDTVEQTSAVAAFFNHDSLSEALADVEQRNALADKLSGQYSSLVANTDAIAAAKDQLEMTKLELASSRVTLDLQFQALSEQQRQQAAELASSKQTLQSAQNELSNIRQQIFALSGDESGKSITFDQAVTYAQSAVAKINRQYSVNLSVPVLLALVKHESNFGNYLGKGTYRQAMCSQKQIDAFLKITKALNMDPESTLVSKPGQNQSCGGAMGYGQFLPTTWQGYASKVSLVTGHNPPSPWDPEDAFTAVALKLTADGAADPGTPAQVRRNQWEALMTYFSGSRWQDPAVLPSIRWYADNILRTADSYTVLVK